MAAYDTWGGSWGSSWALSWTGLFTPTTTTTPTPGGVRRPRFLRRAPKLPWEHEDVEEQEQITVAPPRRKRIPLPVVETLRKTVGDAIPIQTVKEIDAPSITIPELGTAVLQAAEDDDEDWLWLI